MNEPKFPKGWDADRVKRLIAETEALSEEEQVAADEAAAATGDGRTVISVPDEVLPAIRRLLAEHRAV